MAAGSVGARGCAGQGQVSELAETRGRAQWGQSCAGLDLAFRRACLGQKPAWVLQDKAGGVGIGTEWPAWKMVSTGRFGESSCAKGCASLFQGQCQPLVPRQCQPSGGDGPGVGSTRSGVLHLYMLWVGAGQVGGGSTGRGGYSGAKANFRVAVASPKPSLMLPLCMCTAEHGQEQSWAARFLPISLMGKKGHRAGGTA